MRPVSMVNSPRVRFRPLLNHGQTDKGQTQVLGICTFKPNTSKFLANSSGKLVHAAGMRTSLTVDSQDPMDPAVDACLMVTSGDQIAMSKTDWLVMAQTTDWLIIAQRGWF